MILNCVKGITTVQYSRTKFDKVAEVITKLSIIGKMTPVERQQHRARQSQNCCHLFDDKSDDIRNLFFDEMSQTLDDHDYLNFLDGRVDEFDCHKFPGFDVCYEYDPNHRGFCRCKLCQMLYIDTEEENVYESEFIQPRETHPFFTEVPLVAGGKNKKKVKKMKPKGANLLRNAEKGADRIKFPNRDGPVPAEMDVEHTLVQTIAVGALGGSTTIVTTFKGNAPWSSNVVAVQPYAWAADAGVKYAKYRTLGYKYKVELPAGAAPVRLGILNYPSVLASVTIATADGILAIPHAKFKTVGVNCPSIKISGTVSCEKVLGATFPEAYGDDNFSAIVTADPARLCYLNILLSNFSAATATNPFITVTIKFRNILYQPIQLNPLFASDMVLVNSAFEDENLHKFVMEAVEEAARKKENGEVSISTMLSQEQVEREEFHRLYLKYKDKKV